MKKINKHIEIVRCGIPQLSSMGLKSCNMIQKLLSEHYEEVGISYVSDEADIKKLIAKKPDLAFLGFKNLLSNHDSVKIWISDILEINGINFTGSKRPAIELDNNKEEAKEIITAAGLPTAPSLSAVPGQYKNEKDLPLRFPLFIKPPEGGGGIGIDDNSVVRDFSAFERKVASINDDFGTKALVEQYLPGREFSVALLENDQFDELLAMPIELISEKNINGDRFLSRKIKSEDTEHVLKVSPGRLREELIDLALSVFSALGARDYGRLDFRMDEVGKLHFLEANLIPGLAFHDFTSYFTSACFLNENMRYESMILNIVKQALTRGDENVYSSINPKDVVLTT
jgi:D-alanine-D-alanine ligase